MKNPNGVALNSLVTDGGGLDTGTAFAERVVRSTGFAGTTRVFVD